MRRHTETTLRCGPGVHKAASRSGLQRPGNRRTRPPQRPGLTATLSHIAEASRTTPIIIWHGSVHHTQRSARGRWSFSTRLRKSAAGSTAPQLRHGPSRGGRRTKRAPRAGGGPSAGTTPTTRFAVGMSAPAAHKCDNWCRSILQAADGEKPSQPPLSRNRGC